MEEREIQAPSNNDHRWQNVRGEPPLLPPKWYQGWGEEVTVGEATG